MHFLQGLPEQGAERVPTVIRDLQRGTERRSLGRNTQWGVCQHLGQGEKEKVTAGF